MLTIEELKALKQNDWIWLVKIKQPKLSGYRTKISFTGKMFCAMDFNHQWNTLRIEDYDKTWVAYKNKELAEVNENNLPLNVEVQALHMACFFKEAYIKQLKEELEEARKSKEEADGKSITLPYLLCTSNKFACVIWRDKDGKVKKTYTMPIEEAKGVLKEKERMQNESKA